MTNGIDIGGVFGSFNWFRDVSDNEVHFQGPKWEITLKTIISQGSWNLWFLYNEDIKVPCTKKYIKVHTLFFSCMTIDNMNSRCLYITLGYMVQNFQLY